MRVLFEQVDNGEQEAAHIKAVRKTEEIQMAINILESGADTIPVVKDGKNYLCKIHAIYYIESVDKKTYVYTREDCFESKMRLYEFEERLSVFYVRCSKSMIVNLKKIQNVYSELNGRMNAVMLNGETVVISRSYVKEIKRRLAIG